MQDVFVSVQVLNKFGNPAAVLEVVLFFGALVLNRNQDSLVKEGELPETVGEDFKAEFCLLKNRAVGFKGPRRAGIFVLPNNGRFGLWFSGGVCLVKDFPLPPDLHLTPL